jgi:hypothetical protein
VVINCLTRRFGVAQVQRLCFIIIDTEPRPDFVVLATISTVYQMLAFGLSSMC